MMDNNIAVTLDNVSKSYKLYDSPKDRLKEALNPFRKKYHKDFYALEKVNLGQRKGKHLGIIGKNGSGKSTLLKIISGVLQPSEGNIEVTGNISALLELGSGFNPNFTGIENIYFYGSLNGFSKKEMDERIDEIIRFAEIGDFIHQPVKTYSSGMKARLAFAVSTSIDPDILIIDEVLAVGDFNFRQKCSETINGLRDKATVILVSHNMRDIMMLCSSAIVLEGGKIAFQGPSEEAANFYMDMMNAEQQKKIQGRNITTKQPESAPSQPEAPSKKQTGLKKPDQQDRHKSKKAQEKQPGPQKALEQLAIDHKRPKETQPQQRKSEQKADYKKEAFLLDAETGLYGRFYHNHEKIIDINLGWIDEQGNPTYSLRHGQKACLEFSFRLLVKPKNLIVGVPIWDREGHLMTGITTDISKPEITFGKDRMVKGRLTIDPLLFNPGEYVFSLNVKDSNEFYHREPNRSFFVENLPIYYGYITPKHEWEFY